MLEVLVTFPEAVCGDSSHSPGTLARTHASRAPLKLDPSGTFWEERYVWLFVGKQFIKIFSRVVAAPDGGTPGKVGKEQAALDFHKVLCDYQWDLLHLGVGRTGLLDGIQS